MLYLYCPQFIKTAAEAPIWVTLLAAFGGSIFGAFISPFLNDHISTKSKDRERSKKVLYSTQKYIINTSLKDGSFDTSYLYNQALRLDSLGHKKIGRDIFSFAEFIGKDLSPTKSELNKHFKKIFSARIV